MTYLRHFLTSSRVTCSCVSPVTETWSSSGSEIVPSGVTIAWDVVRLGKLTTLTPMTSPGAIW